MDVYSSVLLELGRRFAIKEALQGTSSENSAGLTHLELFMSPRSWLAHVLDGMAVVYLQPSRFRYIRLGFSARIVAFTRRYARI